MRRRGTASGPGCPRLGRQLSTARGYRAPRVAHAGDTVSHNVIRDTGRDASFYGEGIYVGSANHNWCRYSGCKPDESDHDVIIDK